MQLKTLNGDVAKVIARGETHAPTLADVLARDTPVAYAFIGPAFFLLLFLVAYPFVLSVWFSLSDARVGETGAFVGLDNFRRLLTSAIFLQTLQNSVVFTTLALGFRRAVWRMYGYSPSGIGIDERRWRRSKRFRSD